MSWFKPKKKRIYLDYAASTPLRSEVKEAMRPYETDFFAAPGSLHDEGRRAKEGLEKSRKKVALTLSVKPEEVVFTSGGTESNNLAIAGVIKEALKIIPRPRVLTTTIEHASVKEVLASFKETIEVVQIPVNSEGIVDAEDFRKELTPETVLVSVIYVNNEIGTVQPLREIGKIISDFRKARNTQYPYFHTDASQAPLYYDISPERLLADLVTIDGHKMYGPKGIGILIRKRNITLAPVVLGGGQEWGMRPGTEAVPLVVGIAEALSLASHEREAESARLVSLRDEFIESLHTKIPGVILNGDRKKRSPANVNISIPGTESEMLLYQLNTRGIAAATKSACLEEKGEISYVLRALGREEKEGGIRFTLGKDTDRKDIRYTVQKLHEIVNRTNQN